MRVRAPIVAGLVVALLACDDPEEERLLRETEVLVDHLAVIDVDAPPDDRRPLVDALEGLPLHAPSLVEVRHLCVRAHRALLEAEASQGKARTLLGQASGGDAGAPLSTRAEVEIALAIEESNAALARAQTLLPKCETARTGLRARRRGAGGP